MFKRYLRKLMNSLFARETASIRSKENEIDRQVAKLKQIQRANKQQPPRKKDTVL